MPLLLCFLALQTLLAFSLHTAMPELPGAVFYVPLGFGGALAWVWSSRQRSLQRACLWHALLSVLIAAGSAASLSGRFAPLQGELGFSLQPLAFGWALLLAGSSALSAHWGYRRQQPWTAFLLTVALLAAVNAATGNGVLLFALYLGLGSLLILAIQHIQREQTWERRGSDYPTDLRLDSALAALGLSFALLSAALLLSTPAPHFLWRAFSPLTERVRPQVQRLNRALGMYPASRNAPQAEAESLAHTGLPRAHLIGSSPDLATIPVAQVQVNAPLAGTPYWREAVYDAYTGHGWQWHSWQESSLNPPHSLPQRGLWQQVTWLHDNPHPPVLAFGEVQALEYPAQAIHRPPENPYALSTTKQRYVVWSMPPLASAAQLRTAPADYPAWVRMRYTALPAEVPSRLRALALELTRAQPTPYDKAAALEAYLRTFPYTLDLPAPPAERDIAAYFLFELQRGYCDYYATAFVVLARAARLPARLAVGYLGGTYQADTRTYTLHADDAHSWPEVYFPGYGWIPFEPTAGRPALERSRYAATSLPPLPPPRLSTSLRMAWERLSPAGKRVRMLLPVLLLGWAVQWLREQRRRRQPPRTLILHLWGRLAQSGTRGADPLPGGATPRETASHLKASLLPLHSLPGGSRQYTECLSALEHLLQQVHLAWFAPSPPESAALALHYWRRVRRGLWLAYALQRTRQFFLRE